jgi:hypothetical protein
MGQSGGEAGLQPPGGHLRTFPVSQAMADLFKFRADDAKNPGIILVEREFYLSLVTNR